MRDSAATSSARRPPPRRARPGRTAAAPSSLRLLERAPQPRQAAVEVGLHGAERPIGRRSAISASDRSAKNRSATTSRYGSSSAATAARSWASRSERSTRVGGVDRVGAGRRRSALAPAGSTSAHGIEPRDLLALRGPPDREPHGDPRQPGPERPVAAPRGQRPVRDHERLLGDVLGLGAVAEDPGARRDDRRPSRSTRRRKASRSPASTASTIAALIDVVVVSAAVAQARSVESHPPRSGSRARPGRTRAMAPARRPGSMIRPSSAAPIRRTEVIDPMTRGPSGPSVVARAVVAESPPWSSPPDRRRRAPTSAVVMAAVVVAGVLVLALVVVVGVLVLALVVVVASSCLVPGRCRRLLALVVVLVRRPRPSRPARRSRRARPSRGSSVSAGSAVSGGLRASRPRRSPSAPRSRPRPMASGVSLASSCGRRRDVRRSVAATDHGGRREGGARDQEQGNERGPDRADHPVGRSSSPWALRLMRARLWAAFTHPRQRDAKGFSRAPARRRAGRERREPRARSAGRVLDHRDRTERRPRRARRRTARGRRRGRSPTASGWTWSRATRCTSSAVTASIAGPVALELVVGQAVDEQARRATPRRGPASRTGAGTRR